MGRNARRQGVASALLEAAVDHARDHGATTLEAYPVETDGGRIPSANAYMGTLAMFERAGFEVIERRQMESRHRRATDRETRDHASLNGGSPARSEVVQRV